jgi:hypothetical protein
MASKAIVSNQFRIFAAQKFIEGLFETQLSANNLFLWIGKSTEWLSESNPDQPNDTMESRRATFTDMLALKKVSPSDMSLVIPRVDWTSGTVYSQYADDGATYEEIQYDQYEPNTGVSPFYVFTDENRVYKCLSNNSGATSSNKPTGTSTGTITTADGYVWKFMFTLSDNDIQKFLSPDWIPIHRVVYNDGSDQWTVQQTAVEGATTPPGGHGADAITELGAMYVLISVTYQYDESNKVSTANDFRKYGLILNPRKNSSNQPFTSLVASTTTDLTLTDVLGTFNVDETVTGEDSGATAKVVDFRDGIVYLTEISGTFEVGEVLTGDDSGATGLVDSIKESDIQANSGWIIYTEHASPITRAPDQLENFKVVLTF